MSTVRNHGYPTGLAIYSEKA